MVELRPLASWKEKRCWVMGLRLGSRRTWSSLTRSSNGISSWPSASSVVVRTLRRRSANVMLGSSWDRSTRVLTKNPMRSCVS